jgi:ribonucleases P/MRP protein subunit RPP40
LLETIELFSRHKKVLIMGDFNFSDINWKQMSAGSIGNKFLNTINDSFLTQHIKFPTRGDNILDLVISSDKNLVDDIENACPIANSDHNVILWSLRYKLKQSSNNIQRYDYYKGNYPKISSELLAINWSLSLDSLNSEECSDKIDGILQKLREKHIPLKRINNKVYPKWFTSGIKQSIRKRDKAWKRFIKNPTYSSRLLYKLYRNKLVNDIRKSKFNLENKIADDIKTNPKAFYSYINSKTGSKKIGPIYNSNNILIEDEIEMSQTLNTYFSSVYNIEDNSVLPTCHIILPANIKCDLDTIESSEVLSALKNLKSNKSEGSNGLNSSFIKELINELVEPLLILFNKSISEVSVPSHWKVADITPIFKKGKRSSVENYRPISLTAHFSKILERIIKDKIVKYLDENNLINISQHGFVKNKSCLTNLLEFTQNITDWIDNYKPVDIYFLDFNKAFDKVPHNRLLSKLEAHGISGNLLLWIKDWLSDRKQRVVINGAMSSYSNVLSGVPQGSVLGPLLFVIYINDIDLGLYSKILKFADDTKIYSKVSNNEDISSLGKDLATLSSWSKDWLMTFNYSKCKVMHIGHNNINKNLTIDDNIIDECDNITDLGVLFNKDLKFSSQCIKVAKKANKILGLIYRNFENKNKKIMLSLYKSLVRPHLDYCVQIWNPHLEKDILLLERVQKRATKMIQGLQKISYEDRLNRVNLTSLAKRRLRADLLETFKILKGYEKLNSETFFELSTNRNRGHALKLYKMRVNKDVGKFNFGNRIVNIWNKLPDHVVESTSVNIFKSRLDTYLRSVGELL